MKCPVLQDLNMKALNEPVYIYLGAIEAAGVRVGRGLNAIPLIAKDCTDKKMEGMRSADISVQGCAGRMLQQKSRI